MNPFKDEMAKITNRVQKQGTLADALVGADVFVGVSAAGAVTQEMVRSMHRDPIIFAMANPTPEIMPDEAKASGALVIGTGRSDFPNQVNNVLAFPGIFRGALDVHAKEINEEMKLAAVNAIAGLISDDELNADHVIPDPFDPRVAAHVAAAVANAAIETDVAQRIVNVEDIKKRLLAFAAEKQPALL
jgi:malate dehydrogenase (oxaloacetate-decarboxylating)